MGDGGFHLDINTSPSEIMALGSQFKNKAKDFSDDGDRVLKRATELIGDTSTFGNDDPGSQMRSQFPTPDKLEKDIYTAGHKGYAGAAEQVGDNVRKVMALYEESEHKSEGDIGGVDSGA